MLFTSVTRGTGASCFSSAVASQSALGSSLFSFLFFWYCRFRNHDPRQISVSESSTSGSNLHSSTGPFDIQPLCSFRQVTYWDQFLARGTTRHRQLLGISLHYFRKLPQKVGTEKCSTWLLRNVFKNVFCDRMSCFAHFCCNDSACSPFPATTTILFSQSLSCHTLCSCLEILSNTNNFSNSSRNKFQQVSTYAFCSWDDIFQQNGFPVFPITCASAPNLHPRCRPTPL